MVKATSRFKVYVVKANQIVSVIHTNNRSEAKRLFTSPLTGAF